MTTEPHDQFIQARRRDRRRIGASPLARVPPTR